MEREGETERKGGNNGEKGWEEEGEERRETDREGGKELERKREVENFIFCIFVNAVQYIFLYF